MATDQRAYRVYLPQDLADALDTIAREEDRPVARVLREAVQMLVADRAAKAAAESE